MPSMAWWTPSPLRRQSRRIFQVFMRAKVCSTRARTCLWERLCFTFQAGSSSPLRRRCGTTGALVAAVGNRHRVADGGFGAGLLPPSGVVPVAGQRPANHDDAVGVGVDDHLMSR